MTTKALKNRFAIVGLGMLAGRFAEHGGRALQVEAARLAIEDAGLGVADVDGAVDMLRGGGSGDMRSSTDAFPRILGMPCRTFFQVGRGGAAVAILTAAKCLELGLAKHVVVSVSAKDWSSSRAVKQAGRIGWSMIEKEGYFAKPFGDLSAVSHHSFFASRHMHEYGTTDEQLGRIVVAARGWAALNPLARFHERPLSLEEYMAAPMFVDPYRALDVCVVSDGAVAFVLTTAERARDLKRQPVYVMGVGVGEAMERLWWEKANYTRLAVETAKKAAFEEADVELGDIDVAGLYDCFTAEVLFQLEDYGWCGKGEGGAFVEQTDIGPGGSMAINTSGGLLGAYHFDEMTHLSEAVLQLRGDAGLRQVKDARVAMCTSHGSEILSPGMCSTHNTIVFGRS